MVAEQKRLEHEDGPDERDKMDTQLRVSQERGDEGHPNDNVGGRRPHWTRISTRASASGGRCHNRPPEDDVATDGTLEKEKGGRLQPRVKRAESLQSKRCQQHCSNCSITKEGLLGQES